MLRYGDSTAAVALAVILGNGFEHNLRLGLNLLYNSWVNLLSRPLTTIIAATCGGLLAYCVYRQIQFRKKMMIEGPMSDEGMVQFVFDLPASMSDVPEQTCGQSRLGECHQPPPVVDFRLLDPLVILSMRMNHRFLGI